MWRLIAARLARHVDPFVDELALLLPGVALPPRPRVMWLAQASAQASALPGSLPSTACAHAPTIYG